MDDRAPLTIEQQAELIEGIIARCLMRDGSVAGETTLFLNKADVEDLDALAMRLRRMAPHEQEIRRIVTGR